MRVRACACAGYACANDLYSVLTDVFMGWATLQELERVDADVQFVTSYIQLTEAIEGLPVTANPLATPTRSDVTQQLQFLFNQSYFFGNVSDRALLDVGAFNETIDQMYVAYEPVNRIERSDRMMMHAFCSTCRNANEWSFFGSVLQNQGCSQDTFVVDTHDCAASCLQDVECNNSPGWPADFCSPSCDAANAIMGPGCAAAYETLVSETFLALSKQAAAGTLAQNASAMAYLQQAFALGAQKYKTTSIFGTLSTNSVQMSTVLMTQSIIASNYTAACSL